MKKKSLVFLIILIFLISSCAKEQIVEKKEFVVKEPIKEVCRDECINGQKQCYGNDYQECGNYDADTCFEWSSPIKCPEYNYCFRGECLKKEKEERAEDKKEGPEEVMPPPVLPCQNECASSGLQECYGAGLHICGNYDSDNCLEWSSTIPCGEGFVCSGGYCTPVQKEPAVEPDLQECSLQYRDICEELIPGENTEPTHKLNLIFAGMNFDKEIVRAKAQIFLFDEGPLPSAGLFTKTEPFKSNKDKFNFYLINRELADDDFENLREIFSCCNLPNWYGYVFADNSQGKIERSYSGFGPNDYTMIHVQYPNPQAVGAAVHETGHLIGGLYDEYRGGRQHEPASYYNITVPVSMPVAKNVFYDSALTNDNFISVQECRDNTHWKNWIGKGCGNDNYVDCIDKYVFHKTFVLRDKSLSDPSKQDLQWGILEDEFCDYGNEENCFIELNGELVNPFNPGEGFVSEIQEGNVYRQEMFSHDILCKPEYGGTMPGTGECLKEVDCFVGGNFHDYNIYRSTFQSRMAGGPDFGPYNEYLIQQKINEVSSK